MVCWKDWVSMLIDQIDIIEFKRSLNFLHMEELKDICSRSSLSVKGKKIELIARIVHYIKTGEKLTSPKFPKASYAKPGQDKILSKNSLMLKGAYKNDLRTRLFFKKLIGEQFHFTAFGIDWLNARWLSGNPPTYQEFADMWVKEKLRRDTQTASPKEEWAYISFIQDYFNKLPDATHEEMKAAWASERQKRKEYVGNALRNLKAHR